MKKLFILGAFALVSITNAQTIIYGLKAGYAHSQIEVKQNGEGIGNFDPKPGYYATLFVERRLGEKIAIQLEPSYANLGGKISEGETGINMETTINMHRILLPLSLKFYPTYELGIFGGGYLSSRISNKVNIEVDGDSGLTEADITALEEEAQEYLDEGLKSYDYGLVFGAEYNIYKNLVIDARYNLGLGNMIEDPQNGEEMKMNFFQVGLGYRF